MARCVSLHVGVNRVNVAAFSAQVLAGCENDATRMSEIALSRGFQNVKLLLGPEATFERVKSEIEKAATGADRLVAGDIFLFTFAGHGSRIPDTDEEESVFGEPDGKDEALVLFDRLMLDDYLRRVLWPMFDEGVRIVGIADSCHSATVLFAATAVDVELTEHVFASISDGTNVVAEVASVHTVERVLHRATLGHIPDNGTNHAAKNLLPDISNITSLAEDEVVAVGPQDRALTDEERQVHSEKFRSFYEALDIPSPTDNVPLPLIRADLLLMAACQDGRKTKDGLPNGAFTTALLEVWNNGAFSGTYVTFKEQIATLIAERFPGQVPVLKPDVLPAFSGQQPFSI